MSDCEEQLPSSSVRGHPTTQGAASACLPRPPSEQQAPSSPEEQKPQRDVHSILHPPSPVWKQTGHQTPRHSRSPCEHYSFHSSPEGQKPQREVHRSRSPCGQCSSSPFSPVWVLPLLLLGGHHPVATLHPLVRAARGGRRNSPPSIGRKKRVRVHRSRSPCEHCSPSPFSPVGALPLWLGGYYPVATLHPPMNVTSGGRRSSPLPSVRRKKRGWWWWWGSPHSQQWTNARPLL